MSAKGTVRLPGSKSISNRVLLLAALAKGKTVVRDLLHSDDTGRMLEALRTLGVQMESLGDNAYLVTGCGGDFPNKNATLFLGNAGTAFRPLTAALALAGGTYELSGVARMHERPIGDLVDALRQLGADIRYLGTEGFPPLLISPAKLSGDTAQVRGDVSSQFLTGLLMALPLLNRTVKIELIGELISKPYIEITLAMMERFGVVVQRDGWHSFTVVAGSHYVSPKEIFVEGDASSASYFLAAGAIGGGPVRVEGVGKSSVQGDVRFAEALEKMGAIISMGENWIEARAPANHKLNAVDLDCNHIPDAAMTLAVAALYAKGTTTLRNIASWRVKETDRIAAMAIELRKVGATVEEGADFIRVTPPQTAASKNLTPLSPPLSGRKIDSSPDSPHPDKGGMGGLGRLGGIDFDLIVNPAEGIDTYDDHRMAMCFSLAAFGGAGVRINDPKCVAKTFPDYFERFAKVTQSVPVIAIDGPSASGKGTVAQRVASALGLHYLDSGALYRLLGLAAQRRGISLEAEDRLAELAGQVDIRFEGADIWLDGVKVGDELRTEEAGSAASKIAALPKVRAALLDKQRDFRRAPGLVADGRDMASVVFPDSVLKIFLTASAESRAERRFKQLKEKGMGANIAALLQDIQARDERDTLRSVAPLQQAQGASLLDTTTLNIEQAVQEVLSRYQALK
jgi:3-phosphoshikimate 1-carboxyvinyltransferase